MQLSQVNARALNQIAVFGLKQIALALIAAALLISTAPLSAQEGSDLGKDQIFASGALPTDETLLRAFPTTPTFRAFLPEKVDLSRYFPSPGDQGNQASCVGWAVGYAARSYYSQAAENRSIRSTSNIPSPAYIYNSILADPKDCDAGSRIPQALNLLQLGTQSLQDFPYNELKCEAPTQQAIASAIDFRIADWRFIDISMLDQVKGELAQNNPVIISMRVRKTFHQMRDNTVYRADASDYVGQHAMTVTGYDESKQAFRIINSWGRKWGDGGFGWISYDSFKAEVREAYVIRVTTKPEPKPIIVPEPVPEPLPEPSPKAEPKPEPHFMKPSVVVSGLECGHVTIVVRGGKIIAEGFVGSAADMKSLNMQLVGKSIENKTELRPWPQCEILMTLEKQLSIKQSAQIIYKAEADALSTGNLLVFDIKTPAFPSFLHLAYIQADGNVVHLRQSDATNLKTLAPETQIKLGDGKTGPKFRIGEPFGQEMLLAISSRSPLFSSPRPQIETERDFLTALRRSIQESPDGKEERLISASYRAFTTIKGGVVPQ